MPNTVATLALVIFPIISAWLYVMLPPGRALLAVLVLGYLFLPPPPAGFTIPFIPPLTKDTIPSLVALIACLVMYGRRIQFLPTNTIAKVLVLVFIFSPMATTLTNMDPIHIGSFTLPALRFRSGIALCINQALLVSPLLLARNFLHTEKDMKDLMWAMALAGLIYSLPMLLEVRLSPQLNVWVYGYFQHSFVQMVRGDSFRPIVFLYHGLWVAFLALTAFLAMISIARSSKKGSSLWIWGLAGYLGMVLFFCKSAASILYGLVLAPVLMFLGLRTQIRLGVLLACLVLTYPVLKNVHLVPEETILSWAERVNHDRASSLRFRFDNENLLIDRAMERPLFGWGTWGRNHLHNAYNGEISTTVDGRWIITFGRFGWVGFIAEFGLLLLPIFLARKLLFTRQNDCPPRKAGDSTERVSARSRNGVLSSTIGGAKLRASSKSKGTFTPLIGGLVLILAINLVDMIPNATLTPMSWLIAGALLGFCEKSGRHETDKEGKQRLNSIM